MSAAPPRKIKLCPECNADNDDGAKRCWACRGDLANAPEVVLADLVAESGGTSRPVADWVGIGAVTVVGMIMVSATLTQSAGLGLGLALVFIVAIIVLLLARPSVRTSLADRPIPPRVSEKGSYFADSAAGAPANLPLPRVTPASAIVRQVLVTLGVVALVVFAGFIALFVVCIGIIAVATSGPHT